MEASRLTAGGGSFLIADTSAYTGKGFYCLIAQEDTVISTLAGGTNTTATATDFKTSLNIGTSTLKQGALIIAPEGYTFNSVTLSSGSVIGYKIGAL